MKKKMLIIMVTVVMMIVSAMTAYAGEWKQDNSGWWYQNDGGSYPVNTWQWIDGNNDGIAESYYFDSNGYLLVNTTTPDGYQVNENGAWTINGLIQSKPVEIQNNNQTQMAQDDHTAIELPAGTYLVGEDLPAGQYVAVTDGKCYVKIGADPNMNTLYASNMVDYCIPFEVRDGDWVYSSKGMIYSINDIELDISKTGMYVVGKHIKEGNYKLEARGRGYYCITRGMLGANNKIEKNDLFDSVAYVSLKTGQCIEISGCSNNFVAP